MRWLNPASGGWVRERHEEFMEWRWPDDQQAIGYYGWHPSGLVSDKMIVAAERDWRVPVPIAVGGWHSGYSYMAHPNLMWEYINLTLRALLLLGMLMFLRNILFWMMG